MWHRLGLSYSITLLGGATFDPTFDGIQLTDPLQRFEGDRRSCIYVQIMEAPASMTETQHALCAPTELRLVWAALRDGVEPRIRIGLQQACKTSQVMLRMQTFTIR